VQVLINQYRPGAGIGWRRDKAHFDEVIGVSLLSPCIFRFRRKAGEAWERRSLIVEPRSAYLLSGASRHLWEHSIPSGDSNRYSITFRTLARRGAEPRHSFGVGDSIVDVARSASQERQPCPKPPNPDRSGFTPATSKPITRAS
jgi:hypothetical protein